MAHIPKAIDDLTEAQRVHCRARIIEWAELDPSDRADWLEDTVRDVFLLEHKSHNWEGRPEPEDDIFDEFDRTEEVRTV